MPDSTPIYRLDGVCRSFAMSTGSINVLNNLSFSIQRGQWVALVGRSGSGKTTLLHLMGGLDRPNAGQILLDGEDMASMRSARLTALRRKRIGFIFQSYQLFPELSSLENALLPALHWGTDRNAAEKRARTWLERFGLEKRITHRPRELSGGEQQRVAIARALINDPDIILADEPTGNLDKKAAEEIVTIIDNVRKAHDKTLVMVTHDTELAARADTRLDLNTLGTKQPHPNSLQGRSDT